MESLSQPLPLGIALFGALLLFHIGVALLAYRIQPWRRSPARSKARDSRSLADIFRTRTPTGGAALALILLGAVTARLIGLGEGLWLDEITTLVNYIRAPVGDILMSFDSQNQHLLYSLAAKATTALLDAEHETWALRLPAVAFGVGSVWAVYRLGVRVASETEALTAAGLLAFSYHHVWFSQNARGYTGLLLGTLVGTLLFLKLLEDERAGRPGTLLAYAATMALTSMVHLLGAIIVAAHGAVWTVKAMTHRRKQPAWSRWAPGVAVGLATTFSLQLYAVALPRMAGTILEPTMAGTSVAWTDPLWLFVETLRGLAVGLPGGGATLVLGGLITAAGVYSYLRDDPVFTALMLVPPVLTLAALLATGHNLWPRFFFFCAGFGALILVRGVMGALGVLMGDEAARADAARSAGRRSRVAWARGVAGVLLVAAAAVTLPRAWGPKQDFEAPAAFLEERRGPGDSVVTVDLARFPFLQYLQKEWETVEDADDLARLEGSDDTTWVVYTFPTHLRAVQPRLWSHLEREYREVARFEGTVRGGDLIVLAKD